MGAYATVKDTIFSGTTGRELRRHPAEVREVQFWLVAGPGRDPFGIFIFDPDVVALSLGRPAKKVREALQVLVDLGFCHYDEPTGWVWVVEMAHHQFGTPLKAVDFRCQTAQKWYAAVARNPFIGLWFDRYVDDFHLMKGDKAIERREWVPRDGASYGASPGASMPLVLLCDVPGSSQELVPKKAPVVEKTPAALEPTALLRGGELDVQFERLWTAYPKAVERKECRAQFGRLKPTIAMIDQMLAAIEAQRAGDTWQRGFIPKLSNWLKDHRWLDKVTPAGGEAPRITERNSQTLGAAQRFAERRRQGG